MIRDAPIFTAEEMREWLREHDIDWPPYFLDFSPIELAWNAIEKQMAGLSEAGKDNDTENLMKEEACTLPIATGHQVHRCF